MIRGPGCFLFIISSKEETSVCKPQTQVSEHIAFFTGCFTATWLTVVDNGESQATS